MSRAGGEAAQKRLIGLVGFGAIGREVQAILSDDFRFAVLLREGSASARRLPADVRSVASLAALLEMKPALVVEAAGAQAFAEFAPGILASGRDLVAASTGALGDPAVMRQLMDIAAASGARLIVPAGAVGGLDYLGALAGIDGASIAYTSRKPPAAWTDELAARGFANGAIGEAVTLFEGSPAEAARLYPKNLNAGLTVALAAGPGRTKVRVVADPAVSLNTHEIEVESAAGTAFLRFSNRPSATNPKTSAITGHSLAAAVRRRFASLIV